MKKMTLSAVALCLSTAAFTQTDEAAMKAWQESMTPGTVHTMLAQANGTWTTESSMWMAPGTPAMSSKGTCVNSMILGGRFQQSEFKGDMMGMPFEGRGLMGYDNAKKQLVSTWMDNMSTGMMNMEGSWDAGTKRMTFAGTQTDPMTGKPVAVREVYTLQDENHHRMELFVPGPDGKEFKTMEIAFTRAGK